MGIVPHVKITATFRILAHGTAYDSEDESLGLAVPTAQECVLHTSSTAVVTLFESEHLRAPNQNDTEKYFKVVRMSWFFETPEKH